MESGQNKPSIIIYATVGLHGGKPALILRRVIKDPEVIKLFVMTLLKKQVIEMPAIITTSNPTIFFANAKRLRIIK